MAINQSSENKTIDAATQRNEKIFIAYIVILLVTAIVIAVFTWLTWDSGNKLQDAIRRDADARIQEASQGVAKLQQENLKLTSDVAVQKEKTADAERALLELQERVKLRHLSADQRKKLIDFLTSTEASKVPKGPIRIQRLLLDETAQPFAVEIKEAFASAGWPSGDIGRDFIPPGGKIPVGVVLIFHDADHIPKHAGLIQHALMAAGLEPTLGENPDVPEDVVEIMVGIKP